MTYFKSLAVAALLSLGTVKSATDAVAWSYLSNGADWVLISDFVCDKNNQSPIDLRTEDHFEPFKKWNGNDFKKQYSNIKGADVGNFGNTIKLTFPAQKEDEDEVVNQFESEYATEQLGSVEKFYAAQFHFHASSEHTINGKRYDFEMHTVHLPKPEDGEKEIKATGNPIPIIASATGLIFDTVDFDPTITPEDRKIIDKFFDSLDFANLPPTVPGGDSKAKGHSLNANASVPYGDLMRIVNFANRWVYIGSLTTPPCSIGVLHQVVDRVLPISRRHLELYKKHQHAHPQTEYTAKDSGPKGYVVKNIAKADQIPMDITGNWRETQKITPGHNVTYMRINFNPDAAGDQETTAIVIAILLVISLIITGILVMICMGFQKKISAKSSGAAEGGRRESIFAVHHHN